MTNAIMLLKGLLLACLAWIGITITSPNGFLYIHITEGSPGWYGIYLVSFLVLIKGTHNIYTYCRRLIKCFKIKNYRKIAGNGRKNNTGGRAV